MYSRIALTKILKHGSSFGRLVRSQVESAEAEPSASADSGGSSAMQVCAMNTEELLERESESLGGVAVFAGTRVPVELLFQFLADDQTLETFLDHFPAVSRAQAQGVLGASLDLLLTSKLRHCAKT